MARHFIMTVLSLSLPVALVIIGGCAGLEVTTSASGNWTNFAIDNEPPGSVATTVTQDDQGIIWVGSLDGLIRFDGNSWEIYASVMQNMHILCAARDGQGNLWFGTDRHGVFEYTGTEWRSFTPDSTGGGLPGTAIGDIFVDNQDNPWFATVGNIGQRTAPIDYGVTRYDGTSWTSFLDSTDVETIFQDSDGNMWFGTNVGVIRYDGSQWQTFTREYGLADDYVVAICRDNQGNMWFGTWDDGVSRYDGKNWRTFTPGDGLVSDAMHCMLKDNQGNLWFGSYSIDGYYGISRFDGTQWRNFDPWQGRSNYSVSSIFEDDEGDLWFATSFRVVRYNPE
jgi:ligand-binding sensor domain-containing protein